MQQLKSVAVIDRPLINDDLAVYGFALYASLPGSVVLTQLRFACPAVTSSAPRTSHPEGRVPMLGAQAKAAP
jgi:hypothetical protein